MFKELRCSFGSMVGAFNWIWLDPLSIEFDSQGWQNFYGVYQVVEFVPMVETKFKLV